MKEEFIQAFLLRAMTKPILSEARNIYGEEFGEKRLADALVTAAKKTSIDIKKDIIHAIYTFFDGQNAYDDLTFVILKAV